MTTEQSELETRTSITCECGRKFHNAVEADDHAMTRHHAFTRIKYETLLPGTAS
jgi:hypothetical protein